MIHKLEIDGVHYQLDKKLTEYVTKKIGHLDRYLSRHSRESAHAQVKLKSSKIKTKEEFTCEVIMKLPQETITIKETTINIYAAVDIVETKLKNLLKKYKETHESNHKIRRRILERVRRRARQPKV